MDLDRYFQPGSILEITAEDNTLLFIAQIDDFDGTTLKVTESQRHEVPPAMFGALVRLRGFFSRTTPLIFHGQVCGNTSTFWKIDHLEPLRFEEQRANFRQPLNASARVMPVNEIFSALPNTPKDESKYSPCSIVDISTSGVQISCDASAGVQLACTEPFQEGDYLFVSDLCVAPDDEPYAFTCQVKRCIERKDSYLYGCQIYGLTVQEQDRLTRSIFTVQRNELHKTRNARRF